MISTTFIAIQKQKNTDSFRASRLIAKSNQGYQASKTIAFFGVDIFFQKSLGSSVLPGLSKLAVILFNVCSFCMRSYCLGE